MSEILKNIQAVRYHDFSYGHRVFGHENKCAHLHGHNGRVHFYLTADLDSVGRVLDFSVIRDILCNWIENHWDHKFLIYEQDPLAIKLKSLDENGIIIVPFNPTAENMGIYLFNISNQLITERKLNVRVCKIIVEETRKCKAVIE